MGFIYGSGFKATRAFRALNVSGRFGARWKALRHKLDALRIRIGFEVCMSMNIIRNPEE